MTKEDDRIAEIEAREKTATKGPWRTDPTPNDADGWATCILVAATAPSKSNRIYACPPGGSFPAADQEFIAHAREDIPFLLTELRASRERVAVLEKALRAITTKCRAPHNLHLDKVESVVVIAREALGNPS